MEFKSVKIHNPKGLNLTQLGFLETYYEDGYQWCSWKPYDTCHQLTLRGDTLTLFYDLNRLDKDSKAYKSIQKTLKEFDYIIQTSNALYK